MSDPVQSLRWLPPLLRVTVLTSLLVLLGTAAIPNFGKGCCNRRANESAAIATLENVAAAQEQCRAAGAIDVDADGRGEYAYFAELAAGTGVRGGEAEMVARRLSPPLLSGAFARVKSMRGVRGGIVERSGYAFRMFLPDRFGAGVAEAGAGGVAEAAPDPDAAENYWCCYAWPARSSSGNRRVFFVNQEGRVLYTKNTARRYGGHRAPTFSAAYSKMAASKMASSIAANSSGGDNQAWFVVR